MIKNDPKNFHLHMTFNTPIESPRRDDRKHAVLKNI